ncbi:MAG: pilus assembly protein [Acidobacteriia bacterium]|nr:pilus assembly protein [Terriglobia bacterium]
MTPDPKRRRSRQGGSALLEFAVVFPCLTVMFFGSVGLGVMLGRYIQAVQVCRDVAHMYADKSIDFTQTAMQNIVTQKLAYGVGMTNTGGNGVVILSRIVTVYQADCTANGVSTCTNKNQPVITQRVTIGNTALYSSYFGTPSSSLLDSSGNITATNYMTNSSLRAANFETLLDDAVQRATGTTPSPPAQAEGESSYMVEVYFTYPDIGFLGWTTSGGAYVRFAFQ